MTDWTDLANDIRVVDGNHDLGAGELAARLVERGWRRTPPASEDVDAAWREAWNWMVETLASNEGDVAAIEEALEAYAAAIRAEGLDVATVRRALDAEGWLRGLPEGEAARYAIQLHARLTDADR